jgi:SAM-dependent methyltransferase
MIYSKIIAPLLRRKRWWTNRIIYLFKTATVKEGHDYLLGKPKEQILIQQNLIENSKYLVKLISKIKLDKTQSIFELGPGMCRNLNHLYDLNYDNLSGIEINPESVRLMKEKYPSLKVDIITGSYDDELKKIPSNSFDLTFGMNALMYVNPKNHFIFKEVARITRKYLITIEREDHYKPPYCFPINYNQIFTNLGFKEIFYEIPLTKHFRGKYVARIFQKIDS